MFWRDQVKKERTLEIYTFKQVLYAIFWFVILVINTGILEVWTVKSHEGREL
jgi:hypothetical protein